MKFHSIIDKNIFTHYCSTLNILKSVCTEVNFVAMNVLKISRVVRVKM